LPLLLVEEEAVVGVVVLDPLALEVQVAEQINMEPRVQEPLDKVLMGEKQQALQMVQVAAAVQEL
jgi:hypothetical protein